MAYDPAMDRIAALFGVGGPLGGLVGPSYNPMMLDPSYPSGMIPPNPNDPSLLQAPPNLDALDGQVSGFSRGPLQVNPGAGLSLPGNPPPARPPAFADMQAMTPPLPLPRPESSMIPMGSAPPAAGMPGGGPNPIMAGSRVLPFTPEQAAAARSIGVPGGMPAEGPSPAPGPSAPQMSAGPVGGLGGGPNGMGGLGGFFGGDFGDRLQDAFLGLAMGRTPNESIAGAAQMIAQGRERRALEGDVNRTRELAVSLGIPAEVASSLPAKELLPMIRTIQLDRMKGQERKTAVVNGRVVDTNTGAVVYEAPDAGAEKPTSDMIEYELYKKDEENAGRQPKTFTDWKVMLKEAGRNQINFDTGVKLPSGFRWRDPNNQDLGVEPIPGGPGDQIPGELAARIGMADSFLGQAPALRKRIEAGEVTGIWDRAQAGNRDASSQAEVMRQIKSGADALQRMLTGAGMPASEAEEYARRYLPTYTDNAASAANKLDQLVRELESAKAMAMRGRGGASPAVGDDGGGWTDLGNGVRMRQVQ